MRNEHTWRETTGDGVKREIRATKFGGQWKLQSQEKGAAAWTYHDKPALADLEALRDVLFRKYQRRRASHDDLQSVDALIARARAESK